MATNIDVTAIITVLNAGIANFTSKNVELIKKLGDDQIELLGDINKMQSWNIVAGLMPDDGQDIKTAIGEMREEVLVNLEELQKSICAWEKSVTTMVDAPGFMRVDKSLEEEEKVP